MNSFDDGDTTEPGAAPEPERLLQPVPDGQRITVMLAAFEGWNDAGEAASDALRYLNKLWGGKKVGSIDADEYYDFQFTRPTVRRNAVRRAEDQMAVHPDLQGQRAGIQRGRHFCPGHRAVLQMAGVHGRAAGPRRGAQRGLRDSGGRPAGGRAAQPAHPGQHVHGRRPLRERLNLEASQYEGPVGIVGVLSEVSPAGRAFPRCPCGLRCPTTWPRRPSPKAQLALLHRIEELLQVPLDTHELAEESDAWERGVDELATEDPEIAAYVRQLEEAKDTADLPEASGESIAREFERYLKRRGKDKP